MTVQLAEINNHVGNDRNLPPNVRARAVAGLRSPTIAWTTMDPKYERDFHEWISDFMMRVVCVPVWIFIAKSMVLPMWVTVCFMLIPVKHNTHPRNYYWILTETELKIVMVNHEKVFLKGIKQSGGFVRTIPLNSIIACGVEFGKQKPLVPQLYVDIAEPKEDKDGTLTHTAEGLALAGPDWLAQEILRRRDLLDQQDASGHDDCNNTDIQPSFQIAPLLSPRLDDGAAKDGLQQRASFGSHGNAPSAIHNWARANQCQIVAWTTLDPRNRTQAHFYVFVHLVWFLRALASAAVLLPFVLAYGFMPMLCALVNVSYWTPSGLLAIAAIAVIAGLAVVMHNSIQNDCCVVTETDLCVLPKNRSSSYGWSIKRKIPLAIINMYSIGTRGCGRLDQWGASLPTISISTASNMSSECGIGGIALSECDWFLQQILNQRDICTMKSHCPAMKVAALFLL
jgi:hypothetical protein